MNTVITLAALLTPFALIVFAVLTLIRHTEDDEFVDRIGRGERLPDTDTELAELFAAWRAMCDAPTQPALKAETS